MKRLIGLICMSLLLLLSFGGQALAQARQSIARPASHKVELVRIQPDSAVRNSARPGKGLSSTASTQLSVTSVYARNTSGVNQTLFGRGSGIQYVFFADNTGSALTAFEVHFEVFWYDINYGGTQIADYIYQNISFPNGQTGYGIQTTVPTDAVPGPYTILITLCYSDPSTGNPTCVQGSSQMGDPTATGNDSLAGCNATNENLSTGSLASGCGCPSKPKATCITYWDQYAVYKSNSRDCGPASVAMALNYYLQGPHWAQTWAGGRTAGLKAIRKAATGTNQNVDTTATQLETAITHYGGAWQTTTFDPSLPDSALVEIAGAIRARQPVIAFIDASVLGRGPGGHWLIVRGFNTNSSGATQVVAYDPDVNPYSGTYKGGAISIPLTTFNNAIISGAGTSIDVTG